MEIKIDGKSTPYPWPLLARTILILVSFLGLGIVEVVRGPTLLDLKDLLGVTVGEISIIFPFFSIGSVIGCFSVGLIMDKIIWLRYPVLAFLLVMMGLSAIVFPYCPSLPAIYITAFFGGLGGGALDTGGQVLLLDVWRGRDSGPYMHALHFMYGIGAFLAPVLARPFLLITEELPPHDVAVNKTSSGSTATESSEITKELNADYVYEGFPASSSVDDAASADLDVSNLLEDAKFFPPRELDYRLPNASLNFVAQILGQDGDSEPTSVDYLPPEVYSWDAVVLSNAAASNLVDGSNRDQLTIKTLFPILGVFSILISLGYLMYFVYDRRKAAGSSSTPVPASRSNQEANSCSGSPQTKQKDKIKQMVLLVIMMVFFFLYVGLEVAFGTFITTFAVTSKLGLTRQQGSDIAAVFWGAFATMRALAVPAAIFLPPEIIMIFSFITCLVGSVLLSILGDTSTAVLIVGSGLMGVGMASVYATGLLWLERRVEISNRIGAAMTISSSLGAKVFPVLVGQTVEDYPMSFMYITLGISTGCTLLFGVNAVLGRHMSGGLQVTSSLISLFGT